MHEGKVVIRQQHYLIYFSELFCPFGTEVALSGFPTDPDP